MIFCSKCGVYRSEQLILGDLVVEEEPPATFWRGYPLNLLPSQTRTLAELLKSPVVGYDVLAKVFDRPAANTTLRVMMHRLRQKLPSEIVILNSYGRGYRLYVDGEQLSHV